MVRPVHVDFCLDRLNVAVLVGGVAQHLGENGVGARLGSGGDVSGIGYGVPRIDHNALQRDPYAILINELLLFPCVDQVCQAFWQF